MTTHDCKLCKAADTFQERFPNDYSNADVKDVAKEYGFTPAQLRTRLGMPGSTRNDWDDNRITRLKGLVDEGKPMIEIADAFGVSVPRIKQIIKDKQIDTSKGDSERFQAEITAAAALSEQILAAYRAHPTHTVGKLAKTVNTDKGIVRRVLAAYSLPINKDPVEEEADDAVSVDTQPDEDASLQFVADFMRETSEDDIASYVEWAKSHDEAPSGTYIRKQFKSWANAKARAEEMLSV